MSALLQEVDVVPLATRLSPEPASVPAAGPEAVDELSDEDLEHVVGGLTRAWSPLDGGPAGGRIRFGVSSDPAGLPVAGESRP